MVSLVNKYVLKTEFPQFLVNNAVVSEQCTRSALTL